MLLQDPANQHALYNRAICYERTHGFELAVQDFTALLAANPANANAFFNRGCCFESMGKLDKAIADYSSALELDSRSLP